MRFMFPSMEPSYLRTLVAVPLFVLVLTICSYWYVSQIPENPQIPSLGMSIDLPSPKASLDPNVYSIPFCYLIRNSHSYDRKLVRVRAIVDNGIDWPSLRHDGCEGEISLIGAVEPNDRLIEAKSFSHIRVVFDRLKREKWQGPLEANADVVGRFYFSKKETSRFAIVYDFEAHPTRRQW